jgi:CDP-paratose synthetase
MEFPAMLAVAVNGTEALYRACAQLPLPPPVIHVGSGFEYAFSGVPVDEEWPIVPSASLYGAAKAAASALAGGFSDRLAITIMRPFHIYGAGEVARRLGPHIIAQVRAGEPVALTAGEQLRDFIHVGDCSNCLWRGLDLSVPEPGVRTFNIGSGQAITVRHYIDGLAAALSEAGYPARLEFGALPYRTHEPMVSLPDVGRWLAFSSWRPQVSLADGIADLVTAELLKAGT